LCALSLIFRQKAIKHNYMIINNFLIILVAVLGGGCAIAGQADAFNLSELAPGLFVHQGVQEDSNAANQGDIANIGFIVGKKCVAVVDSGGSLAVGKQLRAAITKATPLPVCYVINTHMHPDHVLGNAAFADDKPQFIGHTKLAAALAARSQNYLQALKRDVGAAGDGSVVVMPTQTVADTLELDLGGRALKLQAWRTAHTDNDITVFDATSGALWLSDLLFIGHTPAIDGKLVGWLDVMKSLRAMQATWVIPGHGAPSKNWPAAADPQQQYLELLLRDTRAAIKNKQTIQQAVETVGADQRSKWLLFDSFHRRNITAAYAELEWED
jgi:quinoprotein relay system zinc metallohydrolase 2